MFASADLVQLGYVKEVTFGVTPGAGTSRAVRFTGESLSFDKTKTADKEINSDAQPTGTTTTNAQTTGDIKVHMQYAEYDPFLAGVARGAWNVFGVNGVGAAFSGTFTANTITAGVPTAGASIFTNLQKGQWFRLNAPADPNDGKWVRVSMVTAPTAAVITLDPSTILAATGPIAGCTVAASRLANATTLSHFTIERQATDVAQFFAYTGQTPSKFSTSLTSEQQTEATFSFMGKTGKRGAATVLPGAVTVSNTYEIQNGITGVGTLWENDDPITSTSVKSVSIDIDSALRAQTALGSLGPVGMGVGTLSIKGNLSVYFADGSIYDRFEQDIYTSLIFCSKDAAGNGYVFSLPRVMLTNAKIVAGAKNSDLMAEFQYEAFADRANAVPALRKTIFIDRLGAAVLP